MSSPITNASNDSCCHLPSLKELIRTRVSFDVFDTTLARITSTPEGVFERVAVRLSKLDLLPSSFANRFLQLRKAAQIRAWRQRSTQDICLDEIYAALANVCQIRDSQLGAIRDLELEEEFRCTRGVAPVVQQINELRELGMPIVFISDTYLSEDFVRRLLEKVDAWQPGDKVYVSSEVGLTKARSSLFLHVLEHEGGSANAWTHVGDNWRSDVLAARRVGIHAVHLTPTRPNRYERKFLRMAAKRTITHFGQAKAETAEAELAFATGARIARCSQVFEHPTHNTLYQLGASVAGPMLTLYVLWVLRNAHERGLKRLYFVARDGQVLYELASRLRTRLNLPISLHYLFGSRQAWSLPSIFTLGNDQWDWILKRNPAVTLAMIAERVEVPLPCFLDELRPHMDLPCAGEYLNRKQLQRIRNVLPQTQISKLIQQSAARARERLIRYLVQLGLLDNAGPHGIVDVGWQGRLARRLTTAVKGAGIPFNVCWFYFGMHSADTAGEPLRYDTYCFGPRSIVHYARWFSPNFVEMFTSHGEGLTVGYEVDHSNTCAPQLAARDSQWLDRWGLPQLRVGMMNFLENVPDAALQTAMAHSDAFVRWVDFVLKQLITRPRYCEAEALGNYEFTIDQRDHGAQRFAPRLTFTQALKWLTLPPWNVRDRLPITRWIEGSRRRSGMPTYLLLAPFALLRSICDPPRAMLSRWLR